MHRFRSRNTLFKLRLGSFFFILLILGLLGLIAAIVWEVILNHGDELLFTAIAVGVTLASGLAYLIIGFGVRCPLCHGPLIGKPGCSRNRKAARMFGSYRLAVATRVLVLGRFRCPCCGEPCKCEARK